MTTLWTKKKIHIIWNIEKISIPQNFSICAFIIL